MAGRACILDCAGPTLTSQESAFFRDADPWGFILFARHIETPDQVRRLTSDLRDSVGRDAPILIDQEGGRVARMRGPHWREWLPALDFAEAAGENAAEAMELRARLMAHELNAVGVDTNCAPMLDIARPESHDIITYRCYGRGAETVATLGRATAQGLLAGRVLPIIKHIPGHGRATQDSHFDLPTVSTPMAELMKTDFAPFKALSDQVMAMTAHIVFSDIDPDAPATQSNKVINLIRQDLGFDGLLMTDDLAMQALSGSLTYRAAASLSAGCDMLLYCNGDDAGKAEVAAAAPMLSDTALRRAQSALDARKTPEPFDPAAADARLAEILKDAAHVSTFA